MSVANTVDNGWLQNDPLVEQWQQAIREATHPVQPIGGRTKSALLAANAVSQIETQSLSGIVAYDPSEFLITAKAGTLVSDLVEELAKHEQYLPFDPLFAAPNTDKVGLRSTLGGTVASGMGGPSRLLYGGIRDFVMEVAMLDGLGRLVRGGGKVVKNAAGFDTPKMMVGSYGRLGILLEVTLKVFPRPQSQATMRIEFDTVQAAVQAMQRVLAKPLPISGLVIDQQRAMTIHAAGPTASLSGVVDRIQSNLSGKQASVSFFRFEDRRDDHLDWIESKDVDRPLVRIGVSPLQVVELDRRLSLAGYEFFHASACSICWVRTPVEKLATLDSMLNELNLSAVVVRGQVDQPFLGSLAWLTMAKQIQHAVDPHSRFVRW